MNNHMLGFAQPCTQGTFRNESTLVDRDHVVSRYTTIYFEGGVRKAI